MYKMNHLPLSLHNCVALVACCFLGGLAWIFFLVLFLHSLGSEVFIEGQLARVLVMLNVN